MAAVLSLLAIVTFAIIVTRVAEMMLVQTGLSRETARFQARSAFTWVGFTTTESENVINHPVRRHIVMSLMFVGNVGFITVISTSILTLTELRVQNKPLMISSLLGGLAFLIMVARSEWIDRRVSKFINVMLKRFTSLDIRDYNSLLQLSGEYRVTELAVEEDDWLANRTLVQLKLRDEGVMILGVNRLDGTFIGAPRGSTMILAGDSIIVYGKLGMVERLDARCRGYVGEVEHRQAVASQKIELEQQELLESSRTDA